MTIWIPVLIHSHLYKHVCMINFNIYIYKRWYYNCKNATNKHNLNGDRLFVSLTGEIACDNILRNGHRINGNSLILSFKIWFSKCYSITIIYLLFKNWIYWVDFASIHQLIICGYTPSTLSWYGTSVGHPPLIINVEYLTIPHLI